MDNERYEVKLTEAALLDIENAGNYIGTQFQYAELVFNFLDKISKTMKSFDTMPKRLRQTGFKLDGEQIYMHSSSGYLFFIIIDDRKKIVNVVRVLHEGMNWEFHLEKFLQ